MPGCCGKVGFALGFRYKRARKAVSKKIYWNEISQHSPAKSRSTNSTFRTVQRGMGDARTVMQYVIGQVVILFEFVFEYFEISFKLDTRCPLDLIFTRTSHSPTLSAALRGRMPRVASEKRTLSNYYCVVSSFRDHKRSSLPAKRNIPVDRFKIKQRLNSAGTQYHP